MDGCSELRELGPPPDSIMEIPPPPIPMSLDIPSNLSMIPCSFLCDSSTGPSKVEFIDLSIHSRFDGAWIMLIASFCIGIVSLGTLLAIIMLKLRKDFTSSKVKITASESGRSCEAVLYPVAADSRAIWATLTPRGPTTLVAPVKHEKSVHFETDDISKSRVSGPTRIENPNLPPLNLHRTLRKNKDHAPVV
ncbi:hypothetical protein LSTR_LSTR013684 [Laodelphax striatellus]|uniref:Uncharacterized protein n=1 Tax=Laodelphax striatellus TaxID=195883 RepID=A0A482WKM1_LAOST|nr:hypothetical protein LSTR_LSTR013684 [Laodelphax striatellus]